MSGWMTPWKADDEMLKAFILIMVFAFLNTCTWSSNGGIALNGASGNSPEGLTAVIGEEIAILRQSGQVPFQEPLQVTLESERGLRTTVPFVLAESGLHFRVPPGIASGATGVEVTEGANEPLLGSFTVQRLGVVANTGKGNLIVFDVDHPDMAQEISVDANGGAPLAVATSPDGRWAYVAIAGPSNRARLATVDLTQKPPAVTIESAETTHLLSAIAVLPELSLAVAPAYGESTHPGGNVEIFPLSASGELVGSVASAPVGTTPAARPFDVATGPLLALVTNRADRSISRIDLAGCDPEPNQTCAQVETYIFPSFLEPTGIAVDPVRQLAWVTDYAANQLHVLQLFSPVVQLSESLTLEGGDQGPVAIRITPGGGRALVLNEVSGTVTIVDLTLGSPLLSLSLDVEGLSPQSLSISPSEQKAYITFAGSDEIRPLTLNIFPPAIGSPLPIAGLQSPQGIAIQP